MTIEKKKTIIISLMLDEKSQTFFDEVRKKHFPAFANFTNAHLTLFHCLPNYPIVLEKIKQTCKNTAPFSLYVSGVVNNKSFIAYEIKAEKLIEIQSNLQKKFISMLSKKDTKVFKPHITIQNKTTTYKALKTYLQLSENFNPFSANAIGVTCWYYTKKHWEKQADYLFENSTSKIN